MPKSAASAIERIQHMAVLVRWALLFEGVFIGVGYAFGPEAWSQAPSLAVVKAVTPVALWGFLMLGTSLLIAYHRTRWYGYTSGAVVFALFSLLLTLAIPVTSGWGGPATFGLTAFMHWVASVWTGAPNRTNYFWRRAGD